MNEIYIKPIVAQVYGELVATPYYQDGDVYRYAKHLLVDDNNSALHEMKSIIDEIDDDGDTHHRDLVDAYEIVSDTLSQLDEIIIPKADFEAWVLQRIKSKEMIEYADTLDHLFAQLVLVAYQHGPWQVTHSVFHTDDWIEMVYHEGDHITVIDYRKLKTTAKPSNTSDYVLNRKNPFADVSIRDQRFIYASDYDRFNALELRTSRQITKADKDEDRSFVTLQPGFNIHNSPKVESVAKSNIRFDDTLTTELTQDDDKTYVYLDAHSLSSD